ncbi:hypothetical protein CCACVL1_30024 [Corchorus capsularis]|uniref:Uncharacterized protein n=1 Tax=Corchorus capsularis TaxID=210143 RepID=A0A1R3FZ62_COCAP|nr:hypothetical protein CCACVL1_30024 [Corchorus capsularis]
MASHRTIVCRVEMEEHETDIMVKELRDW